MEIKESGSKPNHLSKLSDIIFVGSSVVFNLAVSGVYIAVKIDNMALLKVFGLIVILLIIPFTITLLGYIKTKAKDKIFRNIIVLCYLLLEVMLDYVLKIPFREILPLHIFYILVLYAAVFSMIGVARRVSHKAGLLVITAFLILMGCLIFMFLG
jgi:hypothetical protein